MNAVRESASAIGQAAVALAGSGLATDARPWHLPRLARAWWEAGASPATLVAVAAIHRPHSTALVDDLGTLTYAELDDAGARLAGGIAARHGADRVTSIAVMCRNHRGFVLASVAAGRLGADLVYLNTEFSGPQLAQVIERMRPTLAVADEEFLPQLAGQDVPVLVAWHDRIADHPDAARRGGSPEDRTTVDELVANHSRHEPGSRIRGGSITLLTSGTTGPPKGAPRRPGPLATLGPVATLLRHTGLKAGDPVLVAPPLFHGFGLAIWALATFLRSPVVLRRRFDPETVLADIDTHRVACVAAVPVMLRRVLALGPEVLARYDRSNLRTVLSGAAPLPPALAQRVLDEFGDVLFNGYGSSEVGIASIATPDDLRAAPGTVGRPCAGTPVRVLDQARNPLPRGSSGTIYVGGPLVFTGYTGGGSKDTAGGLMSTGDVGHFDTEGRLHVEGRADDMIVSGGENVYPQEVEDVLTRHPAITDATVVGVDDEEFGQRLVAYVVAREPRPEPEELSEHVKGNLARFKVPRAFVFVDELPRNAAGKIVRSRLPAE
ncbi:Acyl-CoA synthetase (AMP-forming)/AMP-acid ligase II [Haloechinothrix alba]|uniref:Acyl-CoA synthetase (AMP-forming)/AMP-acid ligase II n=1 Tax=Haloechinothrix alba TaxID=664784 RepID=A0A238ZJK7_9PSEU|nr:AMP-binding protein [Haloechinothrix alba]SNR83595.1 Acyl-CoA synthetase (AMP-forming)/AMP-acid ligase II [Haloechinothrix alba]